ncbi:MAG: hypothetical protein V7718_05065 [Porticoccus sp.]
MEFIDHKAISRKALLTCLFIEASILLLDLLLNYFQLIQSASLQKIFNVAHEQSLGTWFSVVQAAAAGIILLGLHQLTCTRQWRTWGWLLLAIFFLYISIDDAAKIHERLGDHVGRLAADNEHSLLGELSRFFPSYAWQWVFAPFFGAIGLYILLFLWYQLPENQLRLTVVAAFGCWTIAVGIDYIEGREGFFEPIAAALEVKKYTVSHPFLMAEEFMEMFGTSLFLSLFIQRYLSQLNQNNERTCNSTINGR